MIDLQKTFEPVTDEDASGFFEMPNEAYHQSAGLSKSQLWTLHTKTPRHLKEGERKGSPAFALGSAVHSAILEPEQFEAGYYRGPIDRRGKKWDEAVMIAAENRMEALTAGDYDKALFIRDSAHRNEILRLVVKDAIVEASAFVKDPETGLLLRSRADGYSPSMSLMVDLKTATDPSPYEFSKSVHNYGYHVQEVMYCDVWSRAGAAVDGFMFFAVEKTAPYSVVPYELEPGAYQEAAAIYEAAKDRYRHCVETGEWPGYPDTVQRLDIPKWAYRYTQQPEPEPVDETAGNEEEA